MNWSERACSGMGWEGEDTVQRGKKLYRKEEQW